MQLTSKNQNLVSGGLTDAIGLEGDVRAFAPSGASPTGLSTRIWYDLLTPAINGLSLTNLLANRSWLKDARVAAGDILVHEGAHRITDVRYKEWWYFDAHCESGLVMSCSIVFSIVKDHYFLWIYDPKQGKVLVEIEEDTVFTVNEAGTEGLELKCERLSISGRSDRGYTITFDGETMEGEFVLADPIAGRAEVHQGELKTQYSLYQVPQMSLGGTLKNKASGEEAALSGVAYHDHWWGIDNRYTRWEWMQSKFDNGWAASFYQGRYGNDADDLHRYAWLHTPETGYIYFDNATFDFREDIPNQLWRASISGKDGTLTLTATKRVERYEFKPVVLNGVPLGEVRYHQYPVQVTGTFTDSQGVTTTLRGAHGMLEWDWYAIW